MMKQYRKRPVIIEAIQLTDSAFDAPHPNPEHVRGVIYDPVERVAYVDTLEGRMMGRIGDYIIRGVQGELYPCRKEIFEQTYIEVGVRND